MNTLQATLNVVRNNHVDNLELRDTIRKHCISAVIANGRVHAVINYRDTTKVVPVRTLAELLPHVPCQHCQDTPATTSTLSSSCLSSFLLCDNCRMMHDLVS